MPMSMYRFLEFTVAKYMTLNPESVSPEMTLGELEALFAKRDFNAFPVVEGGRLAGIVTKLDFLKAFAFTAQRMVPHYDALMATKVGEVMTRAVVDVSPEQPLTRALQLMVELRARSFPVTDTDKRVIGMIAREDLMRALEDSVKAKD